ncbi:MAG: hypothetical protein ACYDA1_09035 [Vulcanimicrobiaceae bacterium]
MATVDEPVENQVYCAVRDFLRDSNLQGNECWLDPTGGKKTMSAAAALAAFVVGARLVYVDYREYIDAGRVPLAGTEYPRLLQNPLAIYGDLEIDAALANFDCGMFGEAEYIVASLKERVDDPREAGVLQRIIEGYSLWNRFNFKGANNKLGGIALKPDCENPKKPFVDSEWCWSQSFHEQIDANRNALAALSKLESILQPNLAESVPLLAFYAASARRLLDGKHLHLSQSVMLVYAMIERYIVLSLQALGASDENVRFVEERCPNPADCANAGKQMFGEDFEVRPFRGNIMFASGALALTVCDPDRLPTEMLDLLANLARTRNRTEYEHGLIPVVPKADSAKFLVNGAIEFLSGCKSLPEFHGLLDACTFPKLSPERQI